MRGGMKQLATWCALLLMSPSLTAQVARSRARFPCAPASSFALGNVRIGETGSKALGRLGPALAVRPDTIEGEDLRFPVVHHHFRDFILTVSRSTMLVVTLQPLSPAITTPNGLRLGLARAAVQRTLPRAVLDTTTWIAINSCTAGPGATVSLAFDDTGHVSELIISGFLVRR